MALSGGTIGTEAETIVDLAITGEAMKIRPTVRVEVAATVIRHPNPDGTIFIVTEKTKTWIDTAPLLRAAAQSLEAVLPLATGLAREVCQTRRPPRLSPGLLRPTRGIIGPLNAPGTGNQARGAVAVALARTDRKKRRHKEKSRHKEKDRDERRSVLTGKKIKLKVKKDKDDIERDKNREDLLRFLNSAT